jgi:AbrB family looped-hinge helix DNA binding protein
MVKATVSSKGQIAIPKAVREKLNLTPGTELEIDVRGVTMVMRRTVSKFPHWSTMQGMIKGGPSLTKALEEERAAEVAHDEARVKKGR